MEQVKSAVAALGVTGMNVADVRGRGNSEEASTVLAGAVSALPIRSRLSIVVEDSICDEVVDAIIENARMGEPGDGKIFLERVLDVVRVRTGERGEAGL